MRGPLASSTVCVIFVIIFYFHCNCYWEQKRSTKETKKSQYNQENQQKKGKGYRASSRQPAKQKKRLQGAQALHNGYEEYNR